jgi:hypothetical protein
MNNCAAARGVPALHVSQYGKSSHQIGFAAIYHRVFADYGDDAQPRDHAWRWDQFHFYCLPREVNGDLSVSMASIRRVGEGKRSGSLGGEALRVCGTER